MTQQLRELHEAELAFCEIVVKIMAFGIYADCIFIILPFTKLYYREFVSTYV